MSDDKDDKKAVASHNESKSEQEVLDYWTKEQMEGAKPLPLPSVPVRDEEGKTKEKDKK